ncbi:bifunctional hydroxymethylpyrimidine kinase/phosphomethylpyrimidine kinase [Phaeovulum vinaykumarii]|uniref:hydroxymethylpyrimidine kinase n=1 Tax=Phaeovulum vinaykumarii TaxID=407234 RepID=A0A1N7JUQ1_9RHOB|nr:bifunctional hydroxymethylpyrimidine kinase/phosphomethylpyrimidine kinase [Phaeovulum vinaykumarii]SIS53055.1 hydroxymethylpyrimidine kinase /phosphomethylpyrimidine kinase [Phaeovulum vinaykumarii]SOB91481.1 hydroxymethylpyrimidine kinase /phosphomethylpyrimidine kinase [Phaeovulum vinaykumarii]
MIPNILSIAGSDPSGGAGIQADIKAISATGGYAMAVLAALTAQNTQGVQGVHAVPPDFVAAQIAALRADIRIDAVKIGMLGSAEVIAAVAGALEGLAAPVVLDPVMVAKSGDRLLEARAVAALRALLPRATVITPNLPEAADLLGRPEATDTAAMEAQARALLDLGPGAVMLKGGHLPASDCADLLADRQGLHWLSGPRIQTTRTHGTGCTLSSALATFLGHGLPLPEAARRAKLYIAGAIAAAGALEVGQGHGPTHHFHARAPVEPDRP